MKRNAQIAVAVLVVFDLLLLFTAIAQRRLPMIVLAVLFLLLSVAFAWWSLRKGRHVALADAERQIADGQAVAIGFWKPGCMYCERLMRSLRDREDIAWVNVWQDPAADARVRELNGGDQYTPTLVLGRGGSVLRNPSADEVRAAL